MLYESLTGKIIGCMYKVHGVLGCGLVEQPYHKALFLELQKQSFKVDYEYPFIIEYDGERVGEYFADLVVEDKIIIEVKAVSVLTKEHYAQILNYLHLSHCKIGFLVNFRKASLEYKRFILSEKY